MADNKINPYRVQYRLVDLSKELQRLLIEKMGGLYYIQLRIGDGHLADRISDRSYSIDTAVNNIKYMISRCFTVHLDKFIEHINNQEFYKFQRYLAVKTVGDRNVAIAFDIIRRPMTEEITSKTSVGVILRTYLVNHEDRYDDNRTYRIDL